MLLTLQVEKYYIMTQKLIKFIALSLAIGVVTTACNSDNDDPQEPLASTSTVIVSSFSLSKDAKTLPGLDSVYFSIDLNRAEVFNADSLPYGTNVSRLVPVIGTQGCSVAELHFRTVNGKDTVIDYLRHSTDSINFSNGPVKLHLVALDGITERDYQLKVNVHQMESDSLYWNRTARRALPVDMQIPSRQKTVYGCGRYVCLAATGRPDNQAYSIGVITDLSTWDVTPLTPTAGASFPANLDVATLVGGDDVYYILDLDGNLYQSHDAMTWQSTGIRMDHIYGAFGNDALGCVNDNGAYHLLRYPDGQRTALPSEFPVSGTSEMIDIGTKWSSTPQKLMIGGRKADGSLTGAMWGYDGSAWARISRTEVAAGEGKTMFLYSTFTTDSTNWTVKEYPALFAFGGRNPQGVNDPTMYISRDMGLTWKKGDSLIQMPSYIPAMAQVQAFVADMTMTARSMDADVWDTLRDTPLPAWYTIFDPVMSRATKPIAQWQAPMIYLFGGVNAEGTLYNTVWRGAINRLTFKPLQ